MNCKEAGHAEAYFVINPYMQPWRKENLARVLYPNSDRASGTDHKNGGC
jgi:hypothetical protein